jgi:hypothetical protein
MCHGAAFLRAEERFGFGQSIFIIHINPWSCMVEASDWFTNVDQPVDKLGSVGAAVR